MRTFLSKLVDVLHALAFIALILFAQYLASEPPKPRMLIAETDQVNEAVKMVCPIKDGCNELDQVAQSK